MCEPCDGDRGGEHYNSDVIIRRNGRGTGGGTRENGNGEFSVGNGSPRQQKAGETVKK